MRRFCDERIDATRIDREALISDSVIPGKPGVLGTAAPTEFGVSGFSQFAFAQLIEVIGGHCEPSGVLVDAHRASRSGGCAGRCWVQDRPGPSRYRVGAV